MVIADLPDAASAAALSLAVAGTGGAETTTTVLITPEEMDKAAGKKTAYKAPGTYVDLETQLYSHVHLAGPGDGRGLAEEG